MSKRILSILLSVLMLVSAVASVLTVSAAEEPGVVYVSEDGVIPGFSGKVYLSLRKAAEALGSAGGTIYIYGVASSADGKVIDEASTDISKKRGTIYVKGYNDDASLGTYSGALMVYDGDIVFDNVGIIGQASNDESGWHPNGHTITIETGAKSVGGSIHLGGITTSTETNGGGKIVINSDNVEIGWAASTAAYWEWLGTSKSGEMEYYLNGGTYWSIYGGSRNTRTSNIAERNKADLLIKGNVNYYFNGGTFTGGHTGNLNGGTVNGNVFFHLNGGTYDEAKFSFGSQANHPALSATGNNVIIINKKQIYDNGAINGAITIADANLANEENRADRFVIINNAELGTSGDIADTSAAEYKINVTNGRLEPVFAENKYDGLYNAKTALLGFKAFGGIPYVNGTALELNSNGYYTIAKGTTDVTIVSAPVYVSANGDDASAGTSASTAVKTMAAAYEILGSAGGMIVVNGDVEMSSYEGTGELIITNTDGVDTFSGNLIYSENVAVAGALTITNVGLIPQDAEDTLVLGGSANLAIAGSYPARISVDATKALAEINRKISITSGKIDILTLGYGEGASAENLVVESSANAVIGSVVVGGENAVEFKRNVTLNLAGTVSGMRFNNVSKIAGALNVNVNTKNGNFVFVGGLPTVVGSSYAVFSNVYGDSNTTVSGNTATLTIPEGAVAVVTDANGTREEKASGEIDLAPGITKIVYKVPTPIESAAVTLDIPGGSLLVRTFETDEYIVAYKYTITGGQIGEDAIYTPYGRVMVNATISAKPGYVLSSTYANNYTLQINGGTASKFNVANADGTYSRNAIVSNGNAPAVPVTLDISGIDGVTGELPTITESEWIHLATVTVPDGGTLAKDEHVFVGWMYGDTLYRPGDSFYIEKNETINLKAFFRLIVYYDIIFDINGATGTVPTMDRQIEDAIITLPSADGLVRENCEFAGWTDGNEIYQVGDEYRVGNADITFRAIWDKFYSVTFDTNGATSGTAPTLDSVKAGEKVTIPATDIEKTGYTFAGWSDGVKVYNEGDEYTVYSSDVTFTAVWDAEFSSDVYYVKSTGDDTNSGITPDAPLATLAKAVALIGNNDATIVVMDKVIWDRDAYSHEGHITYTGKDPLTGTEYPEAGLDRTALWDAPILGPTTFEYITDYPQNSNGAWVSGDKGLIIGKGFKSGGVATAVIPLKSGNKSASEDVYVEFNSGSYSVIETASYLEVTIQKNVIFVANEGFGGGTIRLGSDNNPIKVNGTSYVTINGKNTPAGVTVASRGTHVDTFTKGYQIIYNDGNKSSFSHNTTTGKVPAGAPKIVVYSAEGGRVTHAYNEPGYVNITFPAGSVAKAFNRDTGATTYFYTSGKYFLENGITDITYLANEIIAAVDVAIPAPVAGEYPATTYSDAKFDATIEWLNLDTDRFMYDNEYQAKVTVTSKAQYIFDDVPMFKVGGVGGLAQFDGDKVVCTVTFPSTGIAPIHTLTFDANGGGVDPTNIEAEHLEVVTLPEKGELNIDGKDLAGWLYNETIYAPGVSFEVPNSDVPFTAVWGDLHTVSFVGGDNTSIGVGGAIADKQWANQKTYILPANNNNYTYNRLGVTFEGWNDGTTTYPAGAEYVMVDTDVTFTAQWKSSTTSSGTPIIWIINPEDIISPVDPVDPEDPADPGEDEEEIKVVVNKDARFFEGYTTGEFKPEENMTRAEAITVILRLIADEDEVKDLYKPTYSDAKTHWAASNIGYLQEAGLLTMFKGSKLSPDKAITREEFVQLIYALGTLEDADSVTFTDVKKSASAYEAICAAAAAGVVEGYPDGTFGMGKTITRAEIVTMLIRFLERTPNVSGVNNPYTDIDESHWAYEYVIEASK